MGSYEKAAPEHRVNPANPNVDIVSFGLRIVFHDAAQPIRWTTPRLFLAPGLKYSPTRRDQEKTGAIPTSHRMSPASLVAKATASRAIPRSKHGLDLA